MYLYSCFQDSYAEIKRKMALKGIQLEFIQAPILTEEQMKQLQGTDQCMVAIDDSTTSTTMSKELAQMFTVARHYNISIVCFWHLIFAATQPSRIMSQNTGYYILMSSAKMHQQVGILGTQLGIRNCLESAYSKEMEKPYSYILVDLVTNRKDLRVRTDILNEHQVVFM